MIDRCDTCGRRLDPMPEWARSAAATIGALIGVTIGIALLLALLAIVAMAVRPLLI